MKALTRLLSLPVLLACLQMSSAQASDCGDAPDQMTMNECANRAFQKADAELNALYKDVEHRATDPQSLTLLVAAQRAWVAFRDAECGFATASTAGGSIHPMMHFECLESQTKTRIGDFKRYLQCSEGDLSCPLPQ